MKLLYAAVVMVLLCSGAVQAAPEAPVEAPRVVGFYADWRRKEVPPDRLPWERLTHVVHAFALPREDGDVDLSHATGLDGLVAAARKHGVVPMLSIGGAKGSEPFRSIGADEEKRQHFVARVMALVGRHRLGGIDIDMESWRSGEKRDEEGGRALLALLRDLRAALKEKGAVLSADVFATDWYGKHVPAEVVDHVDWVNVMAYDASGSWSPRPAPHSSLDLARKSLAYWTGRFGKDRKKKIQLGVPFYGRRFAEGHTRGGKVATVPYRDLVAIDPGASGRDEFRIHGDPTYYNGRPTMRRKLDLVVGEGYGGVSIWELSQDAADPGFALMSLFAKRR